MSAALAAAWAAYAAADSTAIWATRAALHPTNAGRAADSAALAAAWAAAAAEATHTLMSI